MMNQKTIWFVTAVVALLIVVGAVMVAKQRAIAPVAGPLPVVAVPDPQSPQVNSLLSTDKPPVAMPAPAAIVSKTPVPPPLAAAQTAVLDEIRVDLSRLAGTLKMSSPDIPAADGSELPRFPLDLTCYRKNSSPAVSWQGAPSETEAYVLVLERRAPGEKALWSWIVLDVPVSATGLPRKIGADTLAPGQGILAQNIYGNIAYTGPCEPKGLYLYVLRLFALDQPLGLPATATAEEIVAAMQGHVLDAAEIRAHHYLQK